MKIKRMEAPAFHSLSSMSPRLSISMSRRSVLVRGQTNSGDHEGVLYRHGQCPNPQASAVKRLPRRSVLLTLVGFGFGPVSHSANHAFAAPQPADTDAPQVIRTLKLDSGVRIQEILEGDGREAREGDVVEFNYVCRRSNGYFVHSTVDQFSGESSPVILPLDDNQIIAGLKQVLTGMKIGGKRRALIPPSVGYVNEDLKPIPEEFGPRRSLFSHANEPLIFEVLQASCFNIKLGGGC